MRASHDVVVRRVGPGTAVGIASFLLMAVWGLLVPLFAGPDENSNYVHAAAIVRGELVGEAREPTLFESYYRTEVDIDRQFGAANWVPWWSITP